MENNTTNGNIMKVTKWTYFGNGLPIICNWEVVHTADIPHEYYERVRQAVVEELRNNNYHFSGDYHQNGDFGCPIIDNKYSFEVSVREWGDIMAEAYPNEDYTIYDSKGEDCRYLKWAFTSSENEVITPYTKVLGIK